MPVWGWALLAAVALVGAFAGGFYLASLAFDALMRSFFGKKKDEK